VGRARRVGRGVEDAVAESASRVSRALKLGRSDADFGLVRRLLLLVPLALVAAGCFGGGGGGGNDSATLTFGVAAEPTSLDPAVSPDIESRRVSAQLFDGLVALAPGTTDLRPALATTWGADRTGKVWTFQLRDGVTFQDGTPLNGTAVCANFDRWYHFSGESRHLDRSYYWQRVFGGFAGQPSLYAGCVSHGPSVQIRLTHPSSSFLSALPLPAFSILSPASLRGGGTPVGTGPFRLQSWSHGRELVLVRNDDYWGDRPRLSRLVFQVIQSDIDRLHALEAGTIDGYDFVAAQDVPEIQKDVELKLVERPPNDVGYVTINQAKPPMDKLLVRQAVAYGLDRQRLADSFQPRGSASVAQLFQPPLVFGGSADAARYSYRPAESKRLLRLAGLSLPVPVELWYPSNVSRPYLPDPAGAFAILASGLEKAGFKVIAKTAPWDGDYLVRVDQGRAGQLNLVGWTGDFGDPNDFLGTFFSQKTRQFGFDDPQLFRLLGAAAQEPARTTRDALYRRANERVMATLPGVPLVHTEELVALRSTVEGYITSGFGSERFDGVTASS
jgi:peptide/nickel transport system substrate-binding protein